MNGIGCEKNHMKSLSQKRTSQPILAFKGAWPECTLANQKTWRIRSLAVSTQTPLASVHFKIRKKAQSFQNLSSQWEILQMKVDPQCRHTSDLPFSLCQPTCHWREREKNTKYSCFSLVSEDLTSNISEIRYFTFKDCPTQKAKPNII